MAVISKEVAIGDVILSEAPRHYCRCDHPVTGMTAAAIAAAITAGTLGPEGIVPGQAMDFDTQAAQVQTFTAPAAAPLADSGSYRLGFQGIWTAAIAWDANAAAVKAAFELICGTWSGGIATPVAITITASAAACITGTTITFNATGGNTPLIQFDGRLCLDGAVSMQGGSFAKTTVGELATNKCFATTTANADSVILEPVSLAELEDGNDQTLRRSFLTRGPSTVNADAVFCGVGTRADLVTALVALGIQCHRQATMTDEGTPRV